MAFRKRNVAVRRSGPGDPAAEPAASVSGVRPSSLTSHSVTSTGASSLDSLLGGHGGLALGCSLLVEESGTTDFGGALLRYYAAEGLCHGHVLHVVGVGDGWVRELPALAADKHSDSKATASTDDEKMKIAWRYERLGPAGERVRPEDRGPTAQRDVHAAVQKPFCHTFDMSKRLVVPSDAQIHHIQPSLGTSPFSPVVKHLEQSLKATPPNTLHRLVLPTILSPALYPPSTSRPDIFVKFLHDLRSILRRYPNHLTAMLTLPLELFPRSSGTIRWAEILSDGVIELTPFPHLMDASNALNESGGARSTEEQPQGMVTVHKIPINTERGEGGAGLGNSIGEDLAFTVSRRKFVIKPFSLPPLEGDQEAQKGDGPLTGKEVEF